MTDNDLTITCLVDGSCMLNAFLIKSKPTDFVYNLKEYIIAKKLRRFNDIDAYELTLWLVPTPDDSKLSVTLDSVTEKEPLSPMETVFNINSKLTDEKKIIIVERPPVRTPTPARASVEPRSSSSRSDDLRSRIKDIESKFFTDDLSDSSVSSFLKKYVEGNIPLPATKGDIEGLPLVKRRGVSEEAKPELSLLFLDLPKPPSNPGDAVDERFQSNPILKELDKPETQDLPVFGVSGCGKTRSVIEVLYLQWGFYFNASQTDLGSRDLSELADYIGKRTLVNYNSANTTAARNITRLLFLSRLIILEHCLGVPNCHETFSSANWALLQVCPNTFRDVFWELFQKLYKEIKVYGTDEAELIPIICDKFESVHKMLIKLDYPNFSSKSKFRLVIDEAQLLADMKSKSFNSSSSSGIRRPILSPVLHGFRKLEVKNELTIIYCGTGLSIKTLDWVRNSLKDSDTDSKSGRDRNSGSDRNGNGDDSSNSSPHIQFSEWKGVGSVRAYVNRIKNALSDEESKRKVDELISQKAMEELHERLTGRFRPIVTAIEEILKEGKKWESAIKKVEDKLTSWWEREKKGNLCGELDRLEAKIAEYLNYFTGRLTIKEAFGLFLSHYYRLGDPSLVLENDGAWLVEIGFGHIKFFNGVARTVLDEPFVLKATENYFQVKDPLLISQAKQGMLQSNNSIVHGIMWETMMPSVFVETLQNQPVSSSPFSNAFPDLPDENVTIVGYDGQGLRLGASHKYFTMHQFMKAHVENGSKQDDESMPPFYFPAPHVTGPDIIFFVKIKNNIYPCFVQLKLRQKFEKDDAMTALETVSSVTVQKKMKTEHDKQQKSTTSASSDQQQPQLKDYCPDEKYISMVIVYPAKVTDDNFCGVQVDSDPGSDGLKRVSIKIDGSNFSDIFPEDHVKFLNILKKCSENQPSKKPKEKNKFFHLFSKARQTVNFQQLRHE